MGKAIKSGTKVKYRRKDGEIIEGVITDSGTNNGLRVYDADLTTGEKVWGYADQFEVMHTIQDRSRPTLTRHAYQKLVDEDIQWLLANTQDCSERQHIITIVKESVDWRYPP